MIKYRGRNGGGYEGVRRRVAGYFVPLMQMKGSHSNGVAASYSIREERDYRDFYEARARVKSRRDARG